MKTIIEYKSSATETFENLMPSLDLDVDGAVCDLINIDCEVMGSVPITLVQRIIFEPEV